VPCQEAELKLKYRNPKHYSCLPSSQLQRLQKYASGQEDETPCQRRLDFPPRLDQIVPLAEREKYENASFVEGQRCNLRISQKELVLGQIFHRSGFIGCANL
jgi:hypothetical protein